MCSRHAACKPHPTDSLLRTGNCPLLAADELARRDRDCTDTLQEAWSDLISDLTGMRGQVA